MSDKDLGRGLLILDLIFAALDRVDKLKALFQTARSEGRDVTDAELDQLRADDDAANLALRDLIAAKRLEQALSDDQNGQ